MKRVTLGVGRNASVAPSERAPRGSSPSHVHVDASPLSARPSPPVDAVEPSRRGQTPAPPETVEAPARPPSASSNFGAEEDPTTTKLASVYPAAPPAAAAAEASRPIPVHDAADLPTTQFEPTGRKQADSVDQLIASFEVSTKSDQAVARELKAMVGLEPTPPPPGADREGDVDALLAMSGEQSLPFEPPPPPSKHAPARAADPYEAAPPAARAPAPPRESVVERQLPTGPSRLRKSSASISNERGRGGGSTGLILVLGVVALSLAALLVWRLKPGFLSGRTQEKIDAERAAFEADKQKQLAAQEANNCRESLVVADVPPAAEVLLRVGQAPVDVEKMPVSTRLEFVATAEGFAPKRTVVPAGATWDAGGDGKPRFEVAVQLDKSRAKAGAPDLWPAGEPGSSVGGNGPPGTVHIVSTPKGADVWLLVGVGPEATIDQLVCGADVDVLVAGPTALRKRLHVPAADFVSQATGPGGSATSTRSARVSANNGK